MSYYNKYGAQRTPPRKSLTQPSATSPFCTSPCQLQELTLDPDGTYNHAVGGYQTSNIGQARSRSVKEFEETLTALRKENFNLKLRIYFLEERMGTNFGMDKENAIKKNIELKVEVESYKKELAEKQDLLCQAVKAMELDEEEHIKVKDELQQKVNNLQNQLDSLQQKYDDATGDHGDRGFDDDKEFYERNFEKHCSHEPYIQELENKIKELENALEKSKENARDLDNLLQLTENRSSNLASVEEELKEKENALKKQQVDIEERNKIVSNYRVRVSKLEDDLIEKKNDIDFIAKELKEKCLLVQDLKHDNEDLQKLLNENQANLTLERRKIEKHKLSVYERNKRIIELEDEVKQLTKKLTIMQAQFEVAVKTEVQRKNDGARKPQSPLTDANKFAVVEPAKGNANTASGDEHVYSNPRSPSLSQLKLSPRSSSPNFERHRVQSKSPSHAPAECSSNYAVTTPDLKQHSLDQLQQAIGNYQKQISKLEQDQLKACKLIQFMCETRKKNTREIDELKSIITKKDFEIDQLSEKVRKTPFKDLSMVESLSTHLLSPNHSKKSVNSRTDVSKTSSIEVVTNNETSAPDLIEDPKLLLEQYRELTDNLEEQKQVLISTVEETKNQLEDLECKCESLKAELKTRENRIVDLEFELLSLSQGISSESLGMGEKSDVGNEKPASFFIKELEEKDREIEKLESELKKRTCDLQGIVNKELWEKNREIEKLTKRYNEIIATKDQELNQLEGDLSSKTQQLEVLTDRISELGIIVRHQDDSFEIIKKESLELCSLELKLNDSIKERDFYRTQLVEYDNKLKLATEKAIIDTQKLSQLENEVQLIREENEKCENLRQDALEVCSILSRRLEELAYFLDSLLKQKSVLGFLGTKQNEKLRQLINQSLDISHTLSLSISLNPNQSLMQLSNLSALLNTTTPIECDENGDQNEYVNKIPTEISLTYHSHFSQTEQIGEEGGIIATLRSQIDKLKNDIQARDIELEKLGVSLEKGDNNEVKMLSVVKVDECIKEDEEIMDVLLSIVPESQGAQPSSQQIYETLVCTKISGSADKSKYGIDNSDTESWSEPDRAVSKARIGLGDCITPTQSREDIGSTEDDPEKSNSASRLVVSRKSILAENRQTIINLHEQICEMESKLREKEAELEMLKDTCSEITLQLESSQETQKRNMEINEELKRERDELLENVEMLEKKLASTEMVKQETQMQLGELQKTIEEVKTSQKILQETVDLKNKDAQNKMNELELEKGLLIEKLKFTEQKAQDLVTECINAEKKLQLLRDELQFIEQSVREELQLDFEEKLREQDENYEMKLKLLERTAEAELKMFRDEADAKIRRITDEADLQIKQLVIDNQELLSKYDAECMRRVEVDKVMGSIKELEKFKKVVKVAEDRIRSLEDTEKHLKHQLHDTEIQYQSKISMLHCELEKISLSHSESLLEKSRILTEKTELDTRLKEFAEKEMEFARQVCEYKDDFENMKDTFQKQLAHLESQKSRLELRIGELEQVNAELRNRLVRLQATDNNQQNNQQQTSKTPVAHPASSRILELFLNKTVPASFKRQYSENSEYSEDHNNSGRNVFGGPAVSGSAEIDRQHANSSPDLGIESDHGRFSSLEAAVNINRPFLKTLELTESMSNLLSKDDGQVVSCNNDICCTKTKELVNENNDLRKKLLRTRRALEDTVSQLTMANQRKKQVEKTICKQIHKTSQVLRKAKANLDNGSDHEVLKQ
nr:interaptin isoform X2 [Onthophagus taurus]